MDNLRVIVQKRLAVRILLGTKTNVHILLIYVLARIRIYNIISFFNSSIFKHR